MRLESKSGDRYIRAAVVFKSFIATLPVSQLSWPDGHPPSLFACQRTSMAAP